VTVRVLIVDDSELVRAGFRMVLDAEPGIEVVGEAADGLTGVADAARLRPDVALMDVRMPELGGLEATRRIVALDGAPVRVLMLTTFDLDEYLLEAVRAGVSGFILKDTPPDELVAAIVTAARGDALIAPSITHERIEKLARVLPPSPPPPGLDDLTAPELEAFTLIARGLSDAEIAARLALSAADVKTQVAHVLTKLHVRDRIQAVLLAYESRRSLRCSASG